MGKSFHDEGNLCDSLFFIPSEHYTHVDYFGLVSGRDVDKFAASELTSLKSELVDASLPGASQKARELEGQADELKAEAEALYAGLRCSSL